MPGERTNKKRPAAAQDEAPSIAAVEEEEAFPRGGGDKLLTPLEKRRLSQQATADAEAEQKSGAKKKAKVSGGKVRSGEQG